MVVSSRRNVRFGYKSIDQKESEHELCSFRNEKILAYADNRVV